MLKSVLGVQKTGSIRTINKENVIRLPRSLSHQSEAAERLRLTKEAIMKLTSAFLIFGLLGKLIYRNLEHFFDKILYFVILAGIHGQGLLQSGKEYVYQTVIRSAAGTMDVATHTSGESYKCRVRIQKSGNTLNVHVSQSIIFGKMNY